MKCSAPAPYWRWLLSALSLLILFSPERLPHALAQPTPSERYFAETNHTVSAQFLTYWEERGGLFSYGYPITDQFEENGLTVQYFERARFELHPENAGSEYEVLLAQLGSQLTSERDFPPATPSSGAGAGAGAGATYFPETQHTLGGYFLDYWNARGALSRFGFPISEEFPEVSQADHNTYLVQYFERARFEYHPENDEPYTVLLGQLGKQMLSLRHNAASYIQAFNGQLVAGSDLRPLKLKGFNYFPRDYPWTHFAEWPIERVNLELAKARDLGTNVLRLFIRPDDFGGKGVSWGQQEAFRQLVNLARSDGIYLIVGLFDSFRKSPAPDWDNWPSAGTLEESDDLSYLRAIIPQWRNESAILAWDVYNEPDYVDNREYQWSTHRANRLDWLSRMTVEVRRLDPNHLITIGVALSSSNLKAAPDGTSVLSLVDFVSVHYYLRNYPGRSLYAILNELKAQTRKPIVVEEAGQPTFDGFGDDAAQERFLSDVIQAVKSTNTSGLLVWTLYDFPRYADNPEGHYGLYRADDTPKPALETFKLGF